MVFKFIFSDVLVVTRASVSCRPLTERRRAPLGLKLPKRMLVKRSLRLQFDPFRLVNIATRLALTFEKSNSMNKYLRGFSALCCFSSGIWSLKCLQSPSPQVFYFVLIVLEMAKSFTSENCFFNVGTFAFFSLRKMYFVWGKK